MKLILHIGTHKTATTTIQKNLAHCRSQLIKKGIWYPAYSEVLPGIKDHYAHLDLAKGLMGESDRFTPESVGEFLRSLYSHARARRDLDAVLLSSEPFYRGRMPGGGPYWKRRREYIERLAEIMPFKDVRVVLVLRRQDDYLESLYNEHVKATRYGRDIWAFFHDYRSRFEYRRQIELWSERFDVTSVLSFEHLVKAPNVTEAFLAAVLDRSDIRLHDLVAETNVSLPLDLVESKRLLNQTSLSRRQLKDLVGALEAAATGRRTSVDVRWLSSADRRKVLDEFKADNAWLAANYSQYGFTHFSEDIPDRPVFDGLDISLFAEVVAQVIDRGALLGLENENG